VSNSNQQAAPNFGLRAQVVRVEVAGVQKAFAAMDQERAGALVVLEEPIVAVSRT